MRTAMTLFAALAAALVLVATAALAVPSGIVAYPAQGQSAEQERKDQEACEPWARQRVETGADTLRQQQPAAGEAQPPLYLRALAACMAGRGSSIK